MHWRNQIKDKQHLKNLENLTLPTIFQYLDLGPLQYDKSLVKITDNKATYDNKPLGQQVILYYFRPIRSLVYDMYRCINLQYLEDVYPKTCYQQYHHEDKFFCDKSIKAINWIAKHYQNNNLPYKLTSEYKYASINFASHKHHMEFVNFLNNKKVVIISNQQHLDEHNHHGW